MAKTVPRGDVVENVACYKLHHPTVMQEGTRLFPGVAGVLRRLDEIGLILGVCSNKPRPFTLALLDHLGISGRFRVVVGPEDVPRPKPAPDMLILAMKRLGMDASEVLFVGDMVVDIETARAAGVSVWIVPTGSDERGTLENWVPDRLLASLEEIPMLLAMSPANCPSAPAKNKLGQK
jgi:HAD superfamily hydrolase (TIGR01509 family)